MKIWAYFFCLTTISMCFGAAIADGLSTADLKRVGYDQHIGQPLSTSLTFEESDRRTVALGDLFNGKPTLLVLGYYHCPMLCTFINDGLIESLQELRLNVGRDFNVINVSIDPNESPEVAAAKKVEYLKRYGREGAGDGWHFLTGDRQSIAQLTNEAGFRFEYDPASHEYAHPSGFLVLTPEGRISRYFFGMSYDPGELRSAIAVASNGQSGSVITQLILLCYHYNPITGKYGALALSIVRVLSFATVLLLAGWIFWMSRREPKAQSSEAG